jgi:hypothetical protein
MRLALVLRPSIERSPSARRTRSSITSNRGYAAANAPREGEKARFIIIFWAFPRCDHRKYPPGVNLNASDARSANGRYLRTAAVHRNARGNAGGQRRATVEAASRHVVMPRNRLVRLWSCTPSAPSCAKDGRSRRGVAIANGNVARCPRPQVFRILGPFRVAVVKVWTAV